jgi:hypothetical protein
MDSTLASLLAGSGVAGVFCILFVLGLIYPRPVVTDKNAEIAELKAALAAERDRANASVAAADATKTLLAAIQIGQQLSAPGGPVAPAGQGQ